MKKLLALVLALTLLFALCSCKLFDGIFGDKDNTEGDKGGNTNQDGGNSSGDTDATPELEGPLVDWEMD